MITHQLLKPTKQTRGRGTRAVPPHRKMRASSALPDGAREIDAAKRHLLAAERSESFASKMALSASATMRHAQAQLEAAQSRLDEAKLQVEATKDQLAMCRTEVKDAKLSLQMAEKRWGVIDVTDDTALPIRPRDVVIVSPPRSIYCNGSDNVSVSSMEGGVSDCDDEIDGAASEIMATTAEVADMTNGCWACGHCKKHFRTIHEAVLHEQSCSDDSTKTGIKETTQGGWKCEHCKSWFPTLDEADAHEELCSKNCERIKEEIVNGPKHNPAKGHNGAFVETNELRNRTFDGRSLEIRSNVISPDKVVDPNSEKNPSQQEDSNEKCDDEDTRDGSDKATEVAANKNGRNFSWKCDFCAKTFYFYSKAREHEKNCPETPTEAIESKTQPINQEEVNKLVVKGCGSTEINGIYKECGFYEGARMYRKYGKFDSHNGTSGYTLYRRSTIFGYKRWFIADVPLGEEPGSRRDNIFYESSPFYNGAVPPPSSYDWHAKIRGRYPSPRLVHLSVGKCDESDDATREKKRQKRK